MAVKSFNPTSPARRQMTVADFSEISDKAPEKNLLATRSNTGGRNSYGRITVRHKGGGNRRQIRVIDWKRSKDGMKAKVIAIEYDPNRTAYLALIQYIDGEKAYILAPEGLKAGSLVENGPAADIIVGNCIPIDAIPVGTIIHNIELKPGKGAQRVRTAGAGAQLMAKEGA
jgi:large subunit ribosomal protein L2